MAKAASNNKTTIKLCSYKANDQLKSKIKPKCNSKAIQPSIIDTRGEEELVYMCSLRSREKVETCL